MYPWQLQKAWNKVGTQIACSFNALLKRQFLIMKYLWTFSHRLISFKLIPTLINAKINVNSLNTLQEV